MNIGYRFTAGNFFDRGGGLTYFFDMEVNMRNYAWTADEAESVFDSVAALNPTGSNQRGLEMGIVKLTQPTPEETQKNGLGLNYFHVSRGFLSSAESSAVQAAKMPSYHDWLYVRITISHFTRFTTEGSALKRSSISSRH